jgi:hypothetical protein
MKTILFDYSNEAVLYVGENVPALNQLKFGMVDADTRILGTETIGYPKISRTLLNDQTKHFQITKNNDIKELPLESVNEVYLERRRLARIRSPLIERICYSAWTASCRSITTPWGGFENNIESMLKSCNEETQMWSDPLKEYAFTNNLRPEHAYREIKLQLENANSLKLRIYALLVHLVGKVNLITTEEEAGPLLEEILDRFWRDAWI